MSLAISLQQQHHWFPWQNSSWGHALQWKWKWKSLKCVQLFCDAMDCIVHGLYSPWNSPGQNTGVGSLSLLQGISPTQGSNPGLPHCRWILYQLSHKGSPRTLEWVAYPFSSRSFWPKNWNGVSCIAGRFFTNWAVRETLCPSMALVNDIAWIQVCSVA